MEKQAKAPRVTVIDPKIPEKAKLRVAAYARVSSDSADQINSYLAQVDYYTRYIGENEDWELVDIYADATFIIVLNQQSLGTQGVAPV